MQRISELMAELCEINEQNRRLEHRVQELEQELSGLGDELACARALLISLGAAVSIPLYLTRDNTDASSSSASAG